jgi:nucleotide-binding universal stress UspA family protein
MYDHVLVPTDGSEAAAAAINEAVELANLSGATLHGLYVVDTRDYNTLPESKWVGVEAAFEAEGETATAAVVDAAAEYGIPTRTRMERGIPHEEILAYAEENDVDLIVMATHGRTGLDRFLLGSVTEKVIRGASVPVHVMRIED